MHEAHASDRPFRAHARWLEIGWALHRSRWGAGCASEIGRAGLAYAFRPRDGAPFAVSVVLDADRETGLWPRH